MKEFDKEGKVDKGFELLYFKLSRRRKFIRTLWLIPWAILTIGIVAWSSLCIEFKIAIIILIALTEGAQLVINYRKWKKRDDK